MGILKAMVEFGKAHCTLELFAGLCLALNCTVLLLNILFYVVNVYLYPWPIEVHFLTLLEPEQRALHTATFKAFAETMDSNNVTYFIISGTLLGSWRHHDLIPWDDDIDVLVSASDRQAARRALRARVAKDPASFGLYDRAGRGEGYIKQWKFYPQKGKNLTDGKYKTPNVDVFFYLENKTHIWNASPDFLTAEVWPKSHVFPLRRRPLGGLMVPAPCNPKAFLGANFNVSLCQSRTFNHVSETHEPSPPILVPCSRLAHLYPFVHRVNSEGNGSEEFVLEKLRFSNSTLQQFNARNRC